MSDHCDWVCLPWSLYKRMTGKFSAIRLEHFTTLFLGLKNNLNQPIYILQLCLPHFAQWQMAFMFPFMTYIASALDSWREIFSVKTISICTTHLQYLCMCQHMHLIVFVCAAICVFSSATSHLAVSSLMLCQSLYTRFKERAHIWAMLQSEC